MALSLLLAFLQAVRREQTRHSESGSSWSEVTLEISHAML